MQQRCDVLVVGGGPAGLRAAEVARAAGASVVLCEAQPSVGRKFLVAGRGGLNLTHGEAVENFPARYGLEEPRWRDLLAEFSPAHLQQWAHELGTETYVGTSGRVFPRGQKAANLLRAWVRRLRESGVEFHTGFRLMTIIQESGGYRAFPHCDAPAENSILSKAIVLALGGASWPETGSDGAWLSLLRAHGVETTPWQPANCGWNVAWPPALLERAEGLPIKNISVRAGAETVAGELLITRNGLEGGAIYRLGRQLRALSEPAIEIDFKPQLSAEELLRRAAGSRTVDEWLRAWKLGPAAAAILETMFANDLAACETACARVKSCPLPLTGPRPIAEAISSAGGVAWPEIDERLMLKKLPGIFVAGEMIDWEAPTGGYLLQGCFSTGTRAGRSAAGFARGNLPSLIPQRNSGS